MTRHGEKVNTVGFCTLGRASFIRRRRLVTNNPVNTPRPPHGEQKDADPRHVCVCVCGIMFIILILFSYPPSGRSVREYSIEYRFFFFLRTTRTIFYSFFSNQRPCALI